MRTRKTLFGALASIAVLAACNPEEQNLGTPDLTLSVTEVTFDEAGGSEKLSLNATRDWMVETDADWVVVNPESGAASADDQTVTVTVLENTGMDRVTDLKFTIGMKSKYLTVSQAGPGGSAEALVVYANDFDKIKAEKGSNGWDTYLDSFDGWLNVTGSGVETVTYGFDRMTARTNSGNGSAGSYSDYVSLGASGQNYLWFGSGTPYFAVKNITLPEGKRNFTLSFGTERYLYEATDNTFNWDEFKVYVSADGKKWVRPSFQFAGGALPDGRWDLAMSTFSVPTGTSSLYVYFVSSLGSAYALDDLKLVQADEAGNTLDFTDGEEFEIGDNTTGGGNTGGDGAAPESKGKKTVAEFIAAADKANYYELTGKVSGFNPTYCSFDLTDDTGKIYVYSVLDASKAEWTSKISNGGTITIYALYDYYEAKSQHEVVDAYIVSFEGDGSGSVDSGKPSSLVEVTIAEFLAAPEDDTWYQLTGEIISIAKQDYGNFTIKDATGEVYIYGMTNGWVGSNDKSFSQIGLNVGDVVTLGTRRGSYNGSPQGGGNPVPAYYISHVAGEGGSTGGGEVSDASWSYTFEDGDLGSTGSLLDNVTLNGVAWTFVMNDADFLGFDTSADRGLQMGKKADPASSITLSTEGITGTIKKMIINTSGASGTDATLVVKVDGTDFGSSIKTTNSATDYVFEGAASGKIELNWTLSTAAVYIKSIAIYTE